MSIYEATAKKDNEKIGLLKGQMTEMTKDYENMVRAREEAKKQLEAKFEDVYRKIQSNRDITIQAEKRVNDTLKAFQAKFNYELKSLEERIKKDTDNEKKYVHTEFDNIRSTLGKLEKMIVDEKEERLKQTDETLKPVRAKLEQLENGLETENNTRVEREKEILQKISDESFRLGEQLNKERSERITNSGNLKDMFKDDLKMQNKTLEHYSKTANDNFSKMRSDIEGEMDSRFTHQNDIIDNMSLFLTKFQETLKVVGKNV